MVFALVDKSPNNCICVAEVLTSTIGIEHMAIRDELIEELWWYFHDIRNVNKSFPDIYEDMKKMIEEKWKNE